MMSARVASRATASAVVAVSLLAFVLRYESCNLGGILFYLLPFVFSLGVVWLISEPISVLVSDMISRPITTRLLSVLLAFGVHFSIGAVGWAIFPDVPEGESPPVRAAVWIPFWIIGVLFKVGHLSLCPH